MLDSHTFPKIFFSFGQPDIDILLVGLMPDSKIMSLENQNQRQNSSMSFFTHLVVLFFIHSPHFVLYIDISKKAYSTEILLLPLLPAQPLFTVVQSLLVAVPRITRVTQHQVHPTLSSLPPLQNQLTLLLCKSSGDLCASRTFYKTLSTRSCIPVETAITSNTVTTSTNDCSLVFKGPSDPSHLTIKCVLTFCIP